MNRIIRFAIITCSSTRSIDEDTAGAELKRRILIEGWELVQHVVVTDECNVISDAIIAACDLDVDIVLTCGGTGLSLQDVTPEATAAVCDRMVPGIPEAMRSFSMKFTRRR